MKTDWKKLEQRFIDEGDKLFEGDWYHEWGVKILKAIHGAKSVELSVIRRNLMWEYAYPIFQSLLSEQEAEIRQNIREILIDCTSPYPLYTNEPIMIDAKKFIDGVLKLVGEKSPKYTAPKTKLVAEKK